MYRKPALTDPLHSNSTGNKVQTLSSVDKVNEGRILQKIPVSQAVLYANISLSVILSSLQIFPVLRQNSWTPTNSFGKEQLIQHDNWRFFCKFEYIWYWFSPFEGLCLITISILPNCFRMRPLDLILSWEGRALDYWMHFQLFDLISTEWFKNTHMSSIVRDYLARRRLRVF